MGIFDFSNSNHLKKISELESIIFQNENDISALKNKNIEAEKQIEKLKEKLYEFKPIMDLNKEVEIKKLDLNRFLDNKEKCIAEINTKIEQLEKEYQSDLEIYEKLKKQIKIYQNSLEPINYGLYEPIFNYTTSERFKEEIIENKLKQKLLIKENKAITSNEDEIYYQAKYKFLTTSYKKSINSYKKLISIAFNSECDALITKVNWNNVGYIKGLIKDIYFRINSNSSDFCGFIVLQNSIVNELNKFDREEWEKRYSNHMIQITKEFLKLKLDELSLHYEYRLKKQEEKEEERRNRELLREEQKALRDYERAQLDADAKEKKFKNEIEIAKKEFGNDENNNKFLNDRIIELEVKLKQIQEYKERALSMAQQTKRGYIYIISNIGSFGENIYKIGMTRRLEPTDRVNELGGASVPFKFDIHAMIYSENAPALENELHKTFAKNKVNFVNYRKEFFHITLEEIENKIKEIGLDVVFFKIPEAMQFRETQNILNAVNSFIKMEHPKEAGDIIFPQKLK